MGKETFNSIKLGEDLVVIASPLGELSFYYLYDSTNIPAQFSSLINPKKTEFIIDNKVFLPVYIGYTDAQEMIEAKEFTKLQDKLENEDGSNLIVMGLPRKTYTMLDMMHFVPKKFVQNMVKDTFKFTVPSSNATGAVLIATGNVLSQ